MWSDFDEAHGTLSLHRTFHIQKGGRVITGETKTGTEKRTITLPPSTAGLLTRLKKHACSHSGPFLIPSGQNSPSAPIPPTIT